MNFTTLLAQAAAPGGATGILGSPLILFGAIILIFYFMIFRPQQKRAKDHKALISSIERGDKVVMGGGIHGTVFQVEESTVLIEVSKNTVLTFDKGAVQTVIKGG